MTPPLKIFHFSLCDFGEERERERERERESQHKNLRGSAVCLHPQGQAAHDSTIWKIRVYNIFILPQNKTPTKYIKFPNGYTGSAHEVLKLETHITFSFRIWATISNSPSRKRSAQEIILESSCSAWYPNFRISLPVMLQYLLSFVTLVSCTAVNCKIIDSLWHFSRPVI